MDIHSKLVEALTSAGMTDVTVVGIIDRVVAFDRIFSNRYYQVAKHVAEQLGGELEMNESVNKDTAFIHLVGEHGKYCYVIEFEEDELFASVWVTE